MTTTNLTKPATFDLQSHEMFYYVAVHDAGRSALLAGPYANEAEARIAMQESQRKAEQADPWSWFYTFSLAKSDQACLTRFGVL
jgi:hypothetical protein